MKFKILGGLHFNNINSKITFVQSALNTENLTLRDIAWVQWKYTSPRKFSNELLFCKTFNRHYVGSSRDTLECDIIGYNKYDVSNNYVKYLSKFKRVQSLKLTHSVYNQILDDSMEYKNGVKNAIHISANRDGKITSQLPSIFYHTDGNIKIIYPNRFTPTDYGMAFLICLHLAIRYMKKEKLIS